MGLRRSAGSCTLADALVVETQQMAKFLSRNLVVALGEGRN
jgi:hypothetical protein